MLPTTVNQTYTSLSEWRATYLLTKFPDEIRAGEGRNGRGLKINVLVGLLVKMRSKRQSMAAVMIILGGVQHQKERT